MIQRSMVMPDFLQVGSEGRVVTLVQVFLLGLMPEFRDRVEFDEVYAEMTKAMVTVFQIANDLDPDGNWGPATRSLAYEKYGFDLQRAYRHIEGSESKFVQPPDGNVLLY